MAVHTPEVVWDSGTTTSNSYTTYKTATLPALSTISGSSSTDSFASKAIATSNFNGKKIMVGIEVMSGFDDVNSSVTVQLSADGSTWTSDFSTVTADCTPNIIGSKLGFVDFTSTEVPFFRIVANANEANWTAVADGTIKFLYVLPPGS